MPVHRHSSQLGSSISRAACQQKLQSGDAVHLNDPLKTLANDSILLQAPRKSSGNVTNQPSSAPFLGNPVLVAVPDERVDADSRPHWLPRPRICDIRMVNPVGNVLSKCLTEWVSGAVLRVPRNVLPNAEP